MQKFVFSVIFTLLLLELSHGLGGNFVEEEMKGLEEDQIMLRKIRNVRNVEPEAANEGSGEEATDKPAMKRRREVNNKNGSSSSEEATEGSGEEQPTVKQTESPMPAENENNQATSTIIMTEESTTPEEPSTTEESTTPEEPSTMEESTTPEEPSTMEESTTPEEPSTMEESTTPEEPSTMEESTTPEEPSTTEESTTTLEERNSTVPEITTTPFVYVATTQIIILDGKEWIMHEDGNITSRNGTPLEFPNVGVCNDYVRTDAWLNGSKDNLSIKCNDDLSSMKQSYGKWWGIGLAFIISTCVTCCCCYLCIGLDCYLQYRR